MAEPRFRYATAPDGTSIAYARMGTGPAVVIVPPVPFSNVSGDLDIPLMQRVYDRLGDAVELVLYDGRGTGASGRAVDDLSVRAQASDLVAVLDDAQVDRASLVAMYLAVAPAVTVAAERPERVDRMVLYGAVVKAAQALDRPGTAALLTLIDEDWELFARTAALDWMGWGVGEAGEQVARGFRDATTPDVAQAAIDAYARADLHELLGRVQVPTLVLHRRDGRQLTLDQSSDVAAALPDGRLHVLDGTSATLFFDDPIATADLISGFIRPDRRARPSAEPLQAELSPREREVLRLIAAGDSNGEIAGTLGLSVHTVERHAANIYRKIGARGRSDATAWALRQGLDRDG